MALNLSATSFNCIGIMQCIDVRLKSALLQGIGIGIGIILISCAPACRVLLGTAGYWYCRGLVLDVIVLTCRVLV